MHSGHRGEYLLLGELMSPWDLSITSHESDCRWKRGILAVGRIDVALGFVDHRASHESDCRWKTANDKLMISEVMSFVCSDSCENGIMIEKMLMKCLINNIFPEYLWFKSNALEFSMCQMLGQTPWNTWNKMMEEGGVDRQNSKKGFEKNEHACRVEGIFLVSDSTVRPYSKLAGPTRKIQTESDK